MERLRIHDPTHLRLFLQESVQKHCSSVWHLHKLLGWVGWSRSSISKSESLFITKSELGPSPFLLSDGLNDELELFHQLEGLHF